MDDLLREFLTETGEHLDVVDVELVRFEREPGNETILRNIFRLVHTIKGTCGFLGLPRLEALAHAAETLMGKFRDGMPVTSEAVTLKLILAELERSATEPEGADADLIGGLETLAAAARAAESEPEPQITAGALVYQVLERALKPGEASLDDLERAFRNTPGPATETDAGTAGATPAPFEPEPADAAPPSKVQTIRVNVDTLEHLMTMVSELVLTRNQLLEIARRQ